MNYTKILTQYQQWLADAQLREAIAVGTLEEKDQEITSLKEQLAATQADLAAATQDPTQIHPHPDSPPVPVE